ncbi:MAG: hypothetical protein WB985_15065 [Candidatus Acidiferrales bacterium]
MRSEAQPGPDVLPGDGQQTSTQNRELPHCQNENHNCRRMGNGIATKRARLVSEDVARELPHKRQHGDDCRQTEQAHAVAAQQNENRGPKQIELLFNGQTPEMPVRRAIRKEIPDEEERVEEIRPAGETRRQQKVQHRWRQNTKSPSEIETPQADPTVALFLFAQQMCNQEPGNHEKNRDALAARRKKTSMVAGWRRHEKQVVNDDQQD